MKLRLEHYTWGMLRSANQQLVVGDQTVVARSPGIDENVQVRIYERVQTGLNSALLKTDHAFGFFPVGKGEYVACHFQSSPFAEIGTGRRPTFVHYIRLTQEQVLYLEWKIQAVFDLFSEVRTPVTVEEIEPLELETETAFRDARWFGALTANMPLLQAILVHYVNERKVGILSAHVDSRQRLSLMCGVVQCLPVPLRENFSFCTLCDPIKTSAQVIFPTSNSPSFPMVDWAAPSRITGTGGIYTTWISEIAREGIDAFQYKVRAFQLHDGSKNQSLAQALDLRVEFDHWIEIHNLEKVENIADLEALIESIRKFSPIMRLGEAAIWLGMVITQAILLSKQDLASDFVTEEAFWLEQSELHNSLIERIIKEIFAQRYISELARFIIRLDALARAKYIPIIAGFVEGIFLGCIRWSSEREPRLGLSLWEELTKLGWGRERHWAVAMLNSHLVVAAEMLPELSRAIIPIVDSEVLRELGNLVSRSSTEMRDKYPQTIALLNNFRRQNRLSSDLSLLDHLAGSYREIQSLDWFVACSRIALAQFSVDSYSSSAYVQAISELFREHRNDDLSNSLGQVLANNPVRLFETHPQHLKFLFDAFASAGASDLATLCFIALLRHSEEASIYQEANFAKYLAKLSSLDARPVSERLAREAPESSHLPVTCLRLWIEFIKNLLSRASQPIRSRLSAMLVAAIETNIKLLRHQTIDDIRTVIAVSEEQGSRILAPTLTSLVDETIRRRDLAAWAYISKETVPSRGNLRAIYRGTVKAAYRALMIEQEAFTNMHKLHKDLKERGLVWEAAALLFLLLEHADKRELESLSVGLANTILDIDPDGFTLIEMGEILSNSPLLMDAKKLSICCKYLATKEVQLVDRLIALSEQVINRFGGLSKVPKGFNIGKPAEMPHEERGAYFLGQIFYRLRRYGRIHRLIPRL